MSDNYQKYKECIYKWRENNEEKYTTYNTNYQKEYYIKNKQLKINYVLGKRAYNKECKRLCSILL